MKTIKNVIHKTLVKRSKKPFKVVTLKTGVSVGHYKNGTIKIL